MSDDHWDLAVTARGLLEAARLLDVRYHFLVTNPPYLVRGKQSPSLNKFISAHYREGEADIATAFILRFNELLIEGGVHGSVTPLNWFYIKTYLALRKNSLSNSSVRLARRSTRLNSSHYCASRMPSPS